MATVVKLGFFVGAVALLVLLWYLSTRTPAPQPAPATLQTATPTVQLVTPQPTPTPGATMVPTPNGASETLDGTWQPAGSFIFEGDVVTTLQGIVWNPPYWYVSASVPSLSQFNLGRIYRYDEDLRLIDVATFDVSDYPDLPFRGHVSALDYSPIEDKLYVPWMQPNLEPNGSAISEHDIESLEITRTWDTSSLASYMDAIAIDPVTGDLWYSTGLLLGRLPYSASSGFLIDELNTYRLRSYDSSRALKGSPPRVGNFSGLRIRDGLIYAFTHTETAGVPGLGPRFNNGLVVYDIDALALPPVENEYLRFYRYSFPEDAPDQEGGDVLGDTVFITSTDEQVWKIRLMDAPREE